MSGYKDKSQGFAFVYTNVSKLMEDKTLAVSKSRTKTINFNKDGDSNHLDGDVRDRSIAVETVRENLAKLESLRVKLDDMFGKINDLKTKKKTIKKGKKNDRKR